MNLFKNIDEVISVGQIPSNSLINADCLEGMKYIADKSIDMVLCDLPYGTTACKWDIIIPFDKLWEQYERIIKPNGVILLFGVEPFSSYLRLSNIKLYRYDWVWDKINTTNFANVKKMPLNCYEIISVFYKSLPIYNPQMSKADVKNIRPKRQISKNKSETNKTASGLRKASETVDITLRYPRKIIRISNQLSDCNTNNRVHPTQKPVELFEYLIKTYTNEGDLVLDNTSGSGTTAIACLNTNRQYILMEQEQSYYEICLNRIKEWHKNKNVDLF